MISRTLITNNPLANAMLPGEVEKIFLENEGPMNILCLARDKIHEGHKLLTHPLSGSVKPNQSPYKSVIITKEKGNLDFESLKLIEDSIAVARGLGKSAAAGQLCLEDFQLIDLDLIVSGLSAD